jgi:hypothetical protein
VDLHQFIPSDKKKFDSVTFIHIGNTHDVDVMDPNDFGIEIVPIITAICEWHDVAMLSPWVNDILSPSNVIGGIVESRDVVVIDSIPLEENRIVLIGMS